jgi:hypothetical protein
MLIVNYVYKSIVEVKMTMPYGIIGVVSLIFSIILMTISGILKESKNKTCISCYLTPMYKIFQIPLCIGITILLIFFFYKLPDNPEHNEGKLFFLITIPMALLTSYFFIRTTLKLKWVEYDRSTITVNGIFKNKTRTVKEIKKIERSSYGLYRIEFKDEITIYVLPKIFEYFLTFWGKPNSIENLEKIAEIEKKETESNWKDKLLERIFK